MNKNGPILIIEDDEDDIDFYKIIFDEISLTNEVSLFTNAREGLDYIYKPEVRPFLILSDINMPQMNGFELRDIIYNNPDLKEKCVPYLFFTTDASPDAVAKAYQLSVQGIFQKPTSFDNWRSVITNIVTYWTNCMAP